MTKNTTRRCFTSCGIFFLIVFCFYLSTAIFQIYPGASASFVVSLIHGEPDLSNPIASILYYVIYQVAGPLTITALASALTALALTAIFRAIYFTVWMSCVDFSGIRDSEMPRVLLDVHTVGIIAATAFAGAFALSCPYWVMGTRVFPAGVATMMALWICAISIELRWRLTEHCLMEEPDVTIGECVRTGVVFSWGTFLLILAPSCFPILAISFLMALMVLIRDQAVFRLKIVFSALFGIAGGILFSVIVAAVFAKVFDTGTAFNTWLIFAQGAVPSIKATVATAEGWIAFILFVINAALYLGLFPLSFTNIKNALFGHVVVVAIFVAFLLRWPELLVRQIESPSVVFLLGIGLMAILSGGIFASWLRVCFDKMQRRKFFFVRTLMGIVTVLFVGSIAGILGYQNYYAGAARNSADVMNLIRRDYMMAVCANGENVVYRCPVIAEFLGKRLAVVNTFTGYTGEDPIFHGKSLVACRQEDKVLDALLQIGEAPVALYLMNSPIYRDTFVQPLANKRLGYLYARFAKNVENSPLGQTMMGKAFAHKLLLRAQKTLINAGQLDDAAKIDIYNPGLMLSQAEQGKLPAAKSKELQMLVERDGRYRQPTGEFVRELESTYGNVYKEIFELALLRLALRTDARFIAIEKLREKYQKEPIEVASKELLVAQRFVDQEALGQTLLTTEKPALEKLKLYICMNYGTPLVEELYTKHHKIAEEDPTLALFDNRKKMTIRKFADKVSANFSVYGDIADAILILKLRELDKDIPAMVDFVTGFTFQEKFHGQIYQMECLREQVLAALPPKDRITYERIWLQETPQQMGIWSNYLSEPSLAEDERMRARNSCLLQYPLHTVATQLMEQALQRDYGAAEAARYREALEAARQALTIRTDYAYSGL